MRAVIAASVTAMVSLGMAQAVPSVESRVAVALVADLQKRMGPAATVDIRQLVVNVRNSARGSFAVVAAPRSPGY